MQSHDPFVESKTDHQENPEIHSKIESEIHSIDNEIPSQEISSTPIQKKRKLSAACIRLVFKNLVMSGIHGPETVGPKMFGQG